MKRSGTVAAGAAAVLAHGAPGLTAVASVRRRLARFTPQLSGRGRPGHLALTFDDGPDPASTPSFLTELDRLGWRATFFMLGSLAAAAPALVEEVAAAGHEIAVHGHHHVNHLARTPRSVAEDVRSARDTLAGITGHAPRWIRPPYGVLSGATVATARRERLGIVLWSAWGRDWSETSTPAGVADEVESDLAKLTGAAGPTVLLHDSDCTSAPGSWRAGAGALPILAERWAGRYDVGPVGEHFGPIGTGEARA